jgi:microsomal dipeptidase-like Zn-dependent dipeptidase
MKKILKYVLSTLTFLLIVFFFIVPPAVEKFSNKITSSKPHTASERAQRLHSTLWIADLHSDALLWHRDLLKRSARGHVDLPRLIEGNVALQAFTIVSKTPFGLNFERNADTSDMITLLAMAQRWPVRAWFSLKERALYQASRLQQFAEKSQGKFTVIKSKTDLLAYIARRERETAISAGFLGIEGAQLLEGDLANVQTMFDAGFRMMSPSHFFDTEVGGSAHGVAKGGLTELGKQVIRRMEELGMIVDLAHASPKTIDDVLALANKPIFVSHTGVKGTCNNIRNLSDEHIKGIAATGGVIGIAYFEQATGGRDVNAIVRAITYVLDLVGVEHVALGSDFDGTVETPFDTAGLIQLTDALIAAGFSDREIALIMGENVRRLLLELLPD